jgi:hypothetical protein
VQTFDTSTGRIQKVCLCMFTAMRVLNARRQGTGATQAIGLQAIGFSNGLKLAIWFSNGSHSLQGP